MKGDQIISIIVFIALLSVGSIGSYILMENDSEDNERSNNQNNEGNGGVTITYEWEFEEEEDMYGDDDDDPNDDDGEDDYEPISSDEEDYYVGDDEEYCGYDILIDIIDPASGWAQTQETTTHEILCKGPVVKMTLSISLQDSDEEHAETDEGSEPDTVEFTVSDDVETKTRLILTTGTVTTFVFPEPGEPVPVDYLMSSLWQVDIYHEEQIGNSAGILPVGPRTYYDQGCVWEITGSYEYLDGDVYWY